MLYELYKKSYNLKTEEKEYLLENFDSIIDILTAKKKGYKTAQYFNHFKGTCINLFDEDGECVVDTVPYHNVSDLANADEEAVKISKEEFLKTNIVSDELMEILKGRELIFLKDLRTQACFIYDDDNDVHYIFSSKKDSKKKKEKKVVRQTNWYIDYDKGDNVYPTDVRDGLFEEVTVSKKKEELVKQSNVHDPETKEEMLKTLSLLEKFIENDKDFSYDNISIFLHPLSKGSKKRVLRPLKVVGLIRKMKNLSKRFNRNLENKNKLRVISKEFLNNLGLVKSKLSHEEKIEPRKKMAVLNLDKTSQVGYNAQEVAKNAYKLMVEHGWNSDEVMGFIFSNNISINANKEPFLEAFENLKY